VRNAVSLNVGNFQMARLVGPAVAGVLISAVGVGLAFAVNAATFVVVCCALAALRTGELVPAAVAPRGRGQVREALRYAVREPRVRWPIVLIFFIGTFGFNWPIILSAYTQREFGGQAQVYGWLNTALAVGSLAGALLAARTTSPRLWVQFAAALGVGLLILAMGLAPGVVVFVLLLMATGVVSILFNSLNNSTVQLATDPMLRGRVMSIYMLVFMGGVPVGSLIIGGITDAFGPAVSQTTSGVIIVVAALVSGIIAMRQAGLRPHLDLHRESGHLMTITPVDERVRAA
jgi:predicted MFS family arabinose efflux permease